MWRIWKSVLFVRIFCIYTFDTFYFNLLNFVSFFSWKRCKEIRINPSWAGIITTNHRMGVWKKCQFQITVSVFRCIFVPFSRTHSPTSPSSKRRFPLITAISATRLCRSAFQLSDVEVHQPSWRMMNIQNRKRPSKAWLSWDRRLIRMALSRQEMLRVILSQTFCIYWNKKNLCP